MTGKHRISFLAIDTSKYCGLISPLLIDLPVYLKMQILPDKAKFDKNAHSKSGELEFNWRLKKEWRISLPHLTKTT